MSLNREVSDLTHLFVCPQSAMFLTFGPPIPSGFLRKDQSGAWKREEVCGTIPCAAQGRVGWSMLSARTHREPSWSNKWWCAEKMRLQRKRMARGSWPMALWPRSSTSNSFLQLSRACITPSLLLFPGV